MDQCQVTFDPRFVEVGVTGGGEERGIDIGSDKLLAGDLASGTPRKAGLSIKDTQDAASFGIEQTPIADGKIGCWIP